VAEVRKARIVQGRLSRSREHGSSSNWDDALFDPQEITSVCASPSSPNVLPMEWYSDTRNIRVRE
jgi:hypothetical protein